MRKQHTPTDLEVFRKLQDDPALTDIPLHVIVLVADETLRLYKEILKEDGNTQASEVAY